MPQDREIGATSRTISVKPARRLYGQDGEITFAELSWNLNQFSSQVWEPFHDWVSEDHPKDLDRMYIDDGSNYRLTPRSIRLWERRT